VIRIFPIPPPAPTLHNTRLVSGRPQDLERAILILQLDPEEHYTSLMVSGTGWKTGSKEYGRQAHAFRRWARKLPKPDTKVRGDNAWTGEQWQQLLYGQVHKKASELIQTICDLDESNRKNRRKGIEYWFDQKPNKITEIDTKKGERPILPDTHHPPTKSLSLQVNRENNNAKRKRAKNKILNLIHISISIFFTALVIITLLQLYPKKEGPEERRPQNLNNLTLVEYISLSEYPLVRNDKKPPPIDIQTIGQNWKDMESDTQNIEPPIFTLSARQFTWTEANSKKYDL